MILFCTAVLIGVGVGRLRGRRWRALGSLKIRWPWLPALGLLLQLSVGVLPLLGLAGVRPVLLVGSYALLGAWLWLNAFAREGPLRWALVLVAEGWLLNVLVMVPNHGMPVSDSALARIGHAGYAVSKGYLWKHVASSSTTRVPLLGDVIPVPLPFGASAVSVGDVVMLLGIALAAAVVTSQAWSRSERMLGASVELTGA